MGPYQLECEGKRHLVAMEQPLEKKAVMVVDPIHLPPTPVLQSIKQDQAQQRTMYSPFQARALSSTS